MTTKSISEESSCLKYVSFTEANGDLLELSLVSGFQEATCKIGILIVPPGNDISGWPDTMPSRA